MTTNTYKPIFNNSAKLLILSGSKEVESIAYVASVSIKEEFERISTAIISIDDGGFDNEDFNISNADDYLIGKNIIIKIDSSNKGHTLFKGIVLKVRIKISDGHNELIITAKHEAIRMTRVRNNNCFHDSTDSEIVKDIVEKYNIKADIIDTSYTHETMFQYSASDWDFINMRLEACGQLIYCGCNGIVGVVPDINAEPAISIDNGFNLISIDAEVDASQAFDEYSTSSWNFSSQQIEQDQLKSGDYETKQGNLSITDLSGAMGNETCNVINDGMHFESDKISMIAHRQMMIDELSHISGSVSFPGTDLVHPGCMIDISNCGDRINGKAFVSGVEHEIIGDLWNTKLIFGLDGIPFAEHYNNINLMPACGTLPAINGLHIGIVEQISDDPQNQGRILVRLNNGEDITIWARLSNLYAGEQRGMAFFPEIGDEVVIGFINDNPNLAIILGALHSGDKPSTVKLSEENNIKGIYTRENLKVEFDEEKKSILISTPGNNSLLLNDDSKTISIEDANGNKLIMNEDGIKLESSKAISISSKTDITIKGANINIEAQQSMKAIGNASAEMSTSGNAIVKGSIVNIN